MAMSRIVREPEPISAINITPMIDVLLVLIVMLILTIPIQQHKVPVDLPQPGPVAVTVPPHRLEIASGGALSWDGRAIVDAELAVLLAAVVRNDGQRLLHMRTDPAARYERFDQVLATVKRAGIVKLGFIGDRPLSDLER